MSNMQTPENRANKGNLKRLNRLRRLKKAQENLHESKWNVLEHGLQTSGHAVHVAKKSPESHKIDNDISPLIDAYLADSRNALEQQQNMMHDANFQKETLTHDGSCGAYALSVGFCINIVEGRYTASATSVQKLLISWNTTYPKKQCSNIEELKDHIKDYLVAGNTEDMESLIGPVIRVYIGLALTQSSVTGDIRDRFQHALSDDFNRIWGKDALSNAQRANVRSTVAHAARTHANLFFGESNDILSYGYYLDSQEMAVVGQELLGLDIKKVLEISDKHQVIDNVSRIIKKNNSFLEQYASSQNINIEPCSVNSADPSRVVKGFNNEEGHFESISIESEEYRNWQLFKGQVAEIMSQHDLTNATEYVEQQLRQRNLPIPSNLHNRCEDEVYDANEATILSYLKKGIKRFWVDNMNNLENQQVHIMHSKSIYWDVLLTESQYIKYSRNNVARKHNINHSEAYASIGDIETKRLDQSIYPYISTCLTCVTEMIRECQSSFKNQVGNALDLARDFCKSRLNLCILLLAIVLCCTVGILAASMITAGTLFIKHTLQSPRTTNTADVCSMRTPSLQSTELYQNKSPKARYNKKDHANAKINPRFGEAFGGITIGT